MLTFITRRAVESVIVIFIAALTLHTVIMVYLPDRFYREQMAKGYATGDVQAPQASRPQWPAEFFLWLFDPNKTTIVNGDFQTVPTGIDVTIGTLHIQGSGALTGDFGKSIFLGNGETVSSLISTRWLNTLLLVAAALIPTVLIAVPLGVFAASRKNSRLDRALTAGSFVGLSVPPYWFGLMLILFLAVVAKNQHDHGWSWMPYLPPGNVVTAGQENSITSRLYHLILPAAALALSQLAIIARQVRAAMLDVLGKDYVRTALAKGLPRRRVLFRHALRNALIPVITTVTLALPALVSGTIVIESVFGYQGMGELFFTSMGGSMRYGAFQTAGTVDYSMVMVLMLLMVAIVVLSNFLADVMYVILNPRIRTA